ncbi:MAG: T9SS type A sorting domain-containing protein, partial [Balneola sp.]
NISYSIPQTTDVSLKIYDMIGRLVSTLVNKRQASGTYNVSLNASAWASGIYFYRIVAGDFVKTRKLTLIK